ncbi:uncharacterized protein LOC131218729 [Magnolia sinica]|uniref:uncharacterized protein LOC131218729 n=1 Tax=Magnolia sinica TaxID=86752 RepID=UPI00265AD1C9|nr:uncharacterized protein LOC131218729 [Magnolia sinica]
MSSFPGRNIYSIPTQFTSIPYLTEANYPKWKESIEIFLGCMNLDLALEKEEPPKPSDTSTESEITHHDAWVNSNRMCLKILKYVIPETMKGDMPDTENAKEFLIEIENQTKKVKKAETGSLLYKLTSASYNGQGNIREYIFGLIDVVSKLRGLGQNIEDEFVVFLVLNSLPPEFDLFRINYNIQKEKWTLNELVSQCVQEEERLNYNAHLVTSKQGLSKNKKRKQHIEKQAVSSIADSQPQYENQSKEKEAMKVIY